MYSLCLLAGHTEEYLAENHKQISQLARDAFPELESTNAEEVNRSGMPAIGFLIKMV
jgi:hypothetical protein